MNDKEIFEHNIREYETKHPEHSEFTVIWDALNAVDDVEGLADYMEQRGGLQSEIIGAEVDATVSTPFIRFRLKMLRNSTPTCAAVALISARGDVTRVGQAIEDLVGADARDEIAAGLTREIAAA